MIDMKDQIVGTLIVIAVMLALLGLFMLVSWGLEGYASPGFCNMSDGSCYP
jgi:hypothetical protein